MAPFLIFYLQYCFQESMCFKKNIEILIFSTEKQIVSKAKNVPA